MRKEWYVEVEENNTAAYEYMDACNGEVTERGRSGVYLTLDNGERAYADNFAALRPGTKVLCAVMKPSRGKRLTEVFIEAVAEYAAA